MSYNDKAHNVAGICIENRLDALLRPILAINHGRNAPVIKSNDNGCVAIVRRCIQSLCTTHNTYTICITVAVALLLSACRPHPRVPPDVIDKEKLHDIATTAHGHHRGGHCGCIGRICLLYASSEKLRSEPRSPTAWHQASEMSWRGDSANTVWKHLDTGIRAFDGGLRPRYRCFIVILNFPQAKGQDSSRLLAWSLASLVQVQRTCCAR